GSPLDPRAGGTNLLIREGATLVTRIDDILSEIEPMLVREPDHRPLAEVYHPGAEPLDADRARVLEALGPAPTALDDIIRFTGLSAGSVRVILLELDLAGRLAHHPGGAVSLLP